MVNAEEGALRTNERKRERERKSRFTGCNFYLFLSSSSTFLIINIHANTQREQKVSTLSQHEKVLRRM